MITFEHGKSYAWLFPIFVVLFISGFAMSDAVTGNPGWGAITMPVYMIFLFLSELRSGIVLNSWWRAVHLKGSWQYETTLALHAVMVIVFSWFAYSFIRMV